MSDIIVEGDYPPVGRISTGLFSLDMALSANNDLGMPLRCIYEIYGRPNAGKSSLAYYLAGKVNPTGKVELCDLEGLDRDYVVSSLKQSGFGGKLHFVAANEKEKSKLKPRTHEAMMQEMAENLGFDEVSTAILDSVGAIVPIAEAEGDIGDANMGRRAKAVAAMVRKLTQYLKYLEQPKNAYVINHVNQIIGGRGHTTPGGDTLKFLANIRLMISSDEVLTDSNDNPVAFIAQGKVEKLKFGARGKTFRFAIIPSLGVSPELTALIDCVELGLAERKTTVKIGDTSIGYLSKLVEDAKWKRTDKFYPFFDALEDYKRNTFGQAIPDLDNAECDDDKKTIAVTGLD